MGRLIHLVRHPPPDIDPGICYGRLDVAAREVVAAVERLQTGLPPNLPVWTSPLQRCRVLAEALSPSPRLDARLAEMDFGRWEGLAWAAIPRPELDAWAADVAGYAPPGGESARQVQARAVAALAELEREEAVVVTHAGVMRLLLAHWQGLSIADSLALRFAYGEVVSVRVPAAAVPPAGGAGR